MVPNRFALGVIVALAPLGGGGMPPAWPAVPSVAAHAGPSTPPRPLHAHWMGRVVGVEEGVLHVRYPASEGGPTGAVPLAGAFLRAGFYPQSRLPWARGQRVLVLGARSGHATVILFPEAVGHLAMGPTGWSVTGRAGPVALDLEAPRLLGGARLAPNQRVEVFGRRQGDAIAASILAAPPRFERAVVTAVRPGRIRLSGAGGHAWTFATTTVAPDLARHLQALSPPTPVLAVVAPNGAVLGILPLRALPPAWEAHRVPARPGGRGANPPGRLRPGPRA